MKLFIILSCAIVAAIANIDSPVVKEFVSGNNEFSANVYKELLNLNSGNFLVCPLSVSIVMTLANCGAKGATAQEITSALHLPENQENAQEAMKDIINGLKGNDDFYKLDLANKIYIKEGFDISKTFNDVTVQQFSAEIENVDFLQKSEAAGRINQWVEEHTNNRIKNLISPDSIDEYTRLVLVNALYFNANWSRQFVEFTTRNESFYLNNDDSVDVEMMHQTETLRYYENSALDFKFLEIPYKGGEFVMNIALPNEKQGLSLSNSRISDIFADQPYELKKVSLSLPKFTIETTIDFKNVLQNLGVQKAFKDFEADFTGIAANGQDLDVSKVVQKTFIKVSESGTEAAASTALTVAVPYSIPLHPEPVYEFKADHPFVFFIRHKSSGITLFAGRVTNP